MTVRKKKPPVPAMTPEQRETIATALVSTPIQAAETAVAYLRVPYKDCLPELARALTKQVIAVNKGDMSTAERLLISQAHTLDAIYNRLAKRAMDQEYMNHMESFLKLALRAQLQCARTLEILSTIKNPPNVAFVKQANIAHNQQVNNGTQTEQSPVTQPLAIDSTSHLEHTHGEYLDTGTATAASGNDSAMAPVGKGDRPEDTSG